MVVGEVPTGECEVYEGRLCRPYVTSYWRRPDVATEAAIGDLPAIETDLTTFLNVKTSIGLADLANSQLPACFEPLRAFLCSSFFPVCNSSSSSGTSNATTGAGSVPVLPCASVCEAVNTHCSFFFLAEGLQPFNCSAVDTTYGYPLYPASGSCNANVPTTVAEYSALLPEGMALNCMPPVLLPSKKETACVLSCRVTISVVATNVWDTGDGLNVLSFLSSTLLMLTWWLWPGKMKFPSSMVFYLAVGSSMIAFSFIMKMPYSTYYGCGKSDNLHAKASNNAFCFFQYTAIHLGSLICSFWWLATSLNLFLVIVMERNDVAKYEKYLHAVCWGVPVLLWLIPLASGQAMFSNQFSMCWIKDKTGKEALFMQYYFGFIIFIMIVGGVAMISSISKVTYFAFLMKYRQFGTKSSNRQFYRRLNSQIRSMVFVALFLIVYSVVLQYHHTATLQSTYNLVTAQTLTAALCESNGGANCEENSTPPVNPTLVNVMVILSASQGFIIFCVFASRDFYNFWASKLFGIGSISEQREFTSAGGGGGGGGGAAMSAQSPSRSSFRPKKSVDNTFAGNNNGSNSVSVDTESNAPISYARPEMSVDSSTDQ